MYCNKITFLRISAGMTLIPLQAAEQKQENEQPNVLFIILDDMCNWVNYMGGNNQVLTPNIDKLSERAVRFSNAYAAAPLSNPSRAALLSGIQPFVSGIYDNSHEISSFPVVNNSLMMPQHFKPNGYKTIAAGKVFHTKPSSIYHNSMWDDMTHIDGGYGPFVVNSVLPANLKQKWRDFEAWTGPDTDFSDVRNSRKLIEFISQEHDKPFFAAMGFYRPHNPYTAPKRYFDMYDINQINRPHTIPNDLEDIPQYAINNFIGNKERNYTSLLNSTSNYAEQMIRAYLASVTFADDRIGMIMEALENSPYADNTLIVLIGDNGFHQGEKERWGKSALWRKATHVPFLVVPPKNDSRIQAGECVAPVSLIDIYPTLIDVCNLPVINNQLAGTSLMPLLQKTDTTWHVPAISNFLPGNFAVHYKHWNFIRYNDGSKELYNVIDDEPEFFNLANRPEYSHLMDTLKGFLPETWYTGTPEMIVESISEDFSNEEWAEEILRLQPDYIRPASNNANFSLNTGVSYFHKYGFDGAIVIFDGIANASNKCVLFASKGIVHNDGEVAVAFRFRNSGTSFMELPKMVNAGTISLHVRNGNATNATTLTLQKMENSNWNDLHTFQVSPANVYSSTYLDEVISYDIQSTDSIKLRISRGDRFINLFRIDVSPYVSTGTQNIKSSNIKLAGRNLMVDKPSRISIFSPLGICVYENFVDQQITLPSFVEQGIYVIVSDDGAQKIILN
jgi:arylsulfatase A-like enzyme